MRLYRYEKAPDFDDDDGEEITWAPPIRYECVVSAHEAMRLLNDGWKSMSNDDHLDATSSDQGQ